MEETNVVKKKRGRQKGQTFEPREPKAVIKDALLEPFYIKIDDKSFSVMKGTEILAWGYYTNLGSALRAITKFKMAEKTNTVFSLKEYISQHESILEKIVEKVNL